MMELSCRPILPKKVKQAAPKRRPSKRPKAKAEPKAGAKAKAKAKSQPDDAEAEPPAKRSKR